MTAIAPWYAGLRFRMYENNDLNDCLVALACNWIIARSRGRIVPTDADALNVFEYLTNFQGGAGQPTNVLAILDYWRNFGIAGVRIRGWSQIDHRDHGRIDQALSDQHLLFLVLHLPPDGGTSRVWAGLVGTESHAVLGIDTGSTGPVCITWGSERIVDWDYWDDAVVVAIDIDCEGL